MAEVGVVAILQVAVQGGNGHVDLQIGVCDIDYVSDNKLTHKQYY